MKFFFLYLSLISLTAACQSGSTKLNVPDQLSKNEISPAINQLADHSKDLANKKIGLVVNHTSLTKNNIHLVDLLIDMNIRPSIIFAPEHGFRGKEDAGAYIKDETDTKTGIPVVSLYGNKKKPSDVDLRDVDLLIFDIQDVGVRFYTYISTLHYIMEAAAQNKKEVWVLDRPNPHAHYTDGPVLEDKHKSFVGMHPVPVVYGMTIGEYATMIKGEKWIEDAEDLQLKVIPVKYWNRSTMYILPVKPSPNLPNQLSVMLYPSICFFEGTDISLGRGTDLQFQQVGHPALKDYFSYSFIPHPNEGASNPPHKDKVCYGIDLTMYDAQQIFDDQRLQLGTLKRMYKASQKAGILFFLKNNFFEKLSGTDKLRNQLINDTPESEIRNSWLSDLKKFDSIRQKYLIYK